MLSYEYLRMDHYFMENLDIYLRVSTDSQIEDGFGIKNQKELGLKVSIDSSNSEELIRGGKAGADYLLSLNEKNLHVLDEVKSVPILIPSTPGDINSLENAIEKVSKVNRDFYADPILDPIHYGFSNSIVRYYDLRKKFPDIKILMGTGNLTELTDCDSAGANAILMGLVSELSINAVLVDAPASFAIPKAAVPTINPIANGPGIKKSP